MRPDAERVRIDFENRIEVILPRGSLADPAGLAGVPLQMLQQVVMEIERANWIRVEPQDLAHGRHLVEMVAIGVAKIERVDFLVLDQTRPDIEAPVVRVIVPGLRHFYRRFAPGRLYDVPVKLGLRDRPLSENELNPLHPRT